MNKIFGIGFSRTGTTSLSNALKILGYKSVHYPTDEVTYNQLIAGDYNLHLMQRYDAYIEAAPFYAQLDNAFPNSRFVLTLRCVDSWIESMKNHLKYDTQQFEKNRQRGKPFFKMMLFYHAASYGCVFFNEERLRFAWGLHLKNVYDYFKNRDNLLTINICDGDGWEKLCPFLKHEIPNKSFPHENIRRLKVL